MARRPRRSALGSQRMHEALVGSGFVAVPMAVFLVFFIFPIGYAVYISFFDWGVLGKIEGVGLENYRDLVDDEIFHKAVKNTLFYTAGVVPAQMALGLLLAVIVNQKIRARTFFR